MKLIIKIQGEHLHDEVEMIFDLDEFYMFEQAKFLMKQDSKFELSGSKAEFEKLIKILETFYAN